MPTVKGYEPQIQPKPLPAVHRSGYSNVQLETPIERYAGQGEGMAQFGGTVAQVGEQGLSQQLRLQEEEIAKQREVRFTKAQNDATAAMIPVLYDPQNGLLNTKGENSYGAPDSFDKAWSGITDKVRDGLDNSDMQQRFDLWAQQRRNSVQEQLSSHVAQQSAIVDGQQTDTRIKQERDLAMNSMDPVSIAQSLDNQAQVIVQHGKRNGWTDDMINRAIDQAFSDTHVGVIERYLANDQDIFAKTYYEHAQDQILGSEKPKLERALEEGTLRGESQRYARDIWDKNQDATLSDLESSAETITDPKLQDEVKTRLRAYYSLRKQDQAEIERSAAADAKNLVDTWILNAENQIDSGTAMDAVQRQPGWSALPDDARKKLLQYAKDKTEKGKIETDRPYWYGLMREAVNNPKQFAARNLSIEGASKLSDADFKQASELQNKILKGDEQNDKLFNGIRTNTQIIDSALRGIGLDPADKNNRAVADQLWAATDQRVLALQQTTGKPVTRDDVQKIVNDLVTEQTTQGSWWGLLPGGGPFFDQKSYKFQQPQKGPRKFVGPPALPTAPKVNEPSAVNPVTGERLVFRGGQWVKP